MTQNLLLISIKDMFSSKMLKYSLLPFLISMGIVYILFFIVAGIGLNSLDMQSQVQDLAFVQFLMNYAITSWLVSFLVYAIGGFFMLYVSIFIAVLVIGFLTPLILQELHVRHYKDVKMIGYSNIAEALFLTIKWAFGMVLLFILLVPLYFIPLVNIVAFHFPLYYFFHKMITYDVASTICTKEEDKEIKSLKANSLRLKTAFLYIVSLIPFVIFFASVFFVIYIGHSYFVEVRKLRV